MVGEVLAKSWRGGNIANVAGTRGEMMAENIDENKAELVRKAIASREGLEFLFENFPRLHGIAVNAGAGEILALLKLELRAKAQQTEQSR